MWVDSPSLISFRGWHWPTANENIIIKKQYVLGGPPDLKITNFQLPPVSLSRLETKSWVFFSSGSCPNYRLSFLGGQKRAEKEERGRERKGKEADRPTERGREGGRREIIPFKNSPSRSVASGPQLNQCTDWLMDWFTMCPISTSTQKKSPTYYKARGTNIFFPKKNCYLWKGDAFFLGFICTTYVYLWMHCSWSITFM